MLFVTHPFLKLTVQLESFFDELLRHVLEEERVCQQGEELLARVTKELQALGHECQGKMIASEEILSVQISVGDKVFSLREPRSSKPVTVVDRNRPRREQVPTLEQRALTEHVKTRSSEILTAKALSLELRQILVAAEIKLILQQNSSRITFVLEWKFRPTLCADLSLYDKSGRFTTTRIS